MGSQNLCGTMCATFNKILPYLAMISLQIGYSGMHIVTLISFQHGFSHWVLVVYRHAFAALVFTPFAFFVEKKIRPKMTKTIFLKLMVLAFLEPVLDQNLYGIGLQYTSATFVAACVNALPAVTFVMAIIFRMEKVNLKKVHSLAKVIGTLITIAGAMVMTLFKGPVVRFLVYSHGGNHHEAASSSTGQHWVAGTIMLFISICGWAAFFILQNNTLKEYPAPLSVTALICILGSIQGGTVAAIMAPHKSAWALGFDSRLLAASYSGLVCSGIAYYVQSVVNKMRGPVFVTAFSPLTMVTTAILGSIILAEQLHVGSLIGAGIIVCGLYSVVWGKSKEISGSNKLSWDEGGQVQELPVVVDRKNIQGIVDADNIETTVKSKTNHHENFLHQEP